MYTSSQLSFPSIQPWLLKYSSTLFVCFLPGSLFGFLYTKRLSLCVTPRQLSCRERFCHASHLLCMPSTCASPTTETTRPSSPCKHCTMTCAETTPLPPSNIPQGRWRSPSQETPMATTHLPMRASCKTVITSWTSIFFLSPYLIAVI